LAVGIELVEAVRQVAKRNQRRTHVNDLILMRLTHIEDEDIFSGIEAALQFNRRNLRNSVLHGCWFLLWENTTELLVVDQLLDCRMRAANRAVRVFAQLQLAELHGQGIGQKQAANQRLALSKDQLDDLCRLDDA